MGPSKRIISRKINQEKAKRRDDIIGEKERDRANKSMCKLLY